MRIRIRYKKYISPWFDYLLVSKEEMIAIIKDTGWQVKEFIYSNDSHYIAIIEKMKKKTSLSNSS